VADAGQALPLRSTDRTAAKAVDLGAPRRLRRQLVAVDGQLLIATETELLAIGPTAAARNRPAAARAVLNKTRDKRARPTVALYDNRTITGCSMPEHDDLQAVQN